MLIPHRFAHIYASLATSATSPTSQAPSPSPSSNPMVQRPTSNQGVAQTQDHSTSADLWKKAGNDFDFYRQNREELKKQYYQMRNNRFKQ